MSVNTLLTSIGRMRTGLLLGAAVLMLAATLLPLWGMTLVSTQYPEGLRLVVYPSRIVGDVAEINALNHYIGMTPISDDFFAELRYLQPAFIVVAATLVLAALAQRARWLATVPLIETAVLGLVGLGAMQYRLWQFGHQLDPQAAITVAPFTPPMAGMNQIAQFATYSYFSWGFFLPVIAGALVVLVVLADRRAARVSAPAFALA